MSAINHCDLCGKDEAAHMGYDGGGVPLSWCPHCGCLMGFGTWYPKLTAGQFGKGEQASEKET